MGWPHPWTVFNEKQCCPDICAHTTLHSISCAKPHHQLLNGSIKKQWKPDIFTNSYLPLPNSEAVDRMWKVDISEHKINVAMVFLTIHIHQLWRQRLGAWDSCRWSRSCNALGFLFFASIQLLFSGCISCPLVVLIDKFHHSIKTASSDERALAVRAHVGACCLPNALRLKPHCLIIVHGGGNCLRLGQCMPGVNINVFCQHVFVTWCVAPASIKCFQVKSEQLPAIHRNGNLGPLCMWHSLWPLDYQRS